MELKPWTRGPLYLAKGEAETPLAVANLQMLGNTFNLPVALLAQSALAYGLDFIFESSPPINVILFTYIQLSTRR